MKPCIVRKVLKVRTAYYYSVVADNAAAAVAMAGQRRGRLLGFRQEGPPELVSMAAVPEVPESLAGVATVDQGQRAGKSANQTSPQVSDVSLAELEHLVRDASMAIREIENKWDTPQLAETVQVAAKLREHIEDRLAGQCDRNGNRNCLQGYACPKCHQYKRFTVHCRTCIEMTDQGSGDHDEVEWGEDGDWMRCPDCGEEGRAELFELCNQPGDWLDG